MNTFSKMWNIRTPQEAKDIIAAQIADLNITDPSNLEEQALSLVGKDVYEKLVKDIPRNSGAETARNCRHLSSADFRFDLLMIIIILMIVIRESRSEAILRSWRSFWKVQMCGQVWIS